MRKKNLHIPVSKKHLDEIVSGEKKYYHLSVNRFWASRIVNRIRKEKKSSITVSIEENLLSGDYNIEEFEKQWGKPAFFKFKTITFISGRGKSPAQANVECKGITIRIRTRTNGGSNEFFKIELGEIEQIRYYRD